MEAGAATGAFDAAAYIGYLQDTAGVDADSMPDATRLALAAEILVSRGLKPVAPSARKGVHPFVVPIATDEKTGRTTGLLRQPLKVGTELQLVESSDRCLSLLADSVDKFIKRAAIELAFSEDATGTAIVEKAVALGFQVDEGCAQAKKLGLQRALLVNVGAFVDLYAWLARDWLGKGKEEEALITCSRAANLLPDWGQLHWLHSQILADIGGRELEARDCARAAVQLPLWSIGEPDLAPVAKRAESSMEVMRTSYLKWCESGGPEEDFVNSGLGSAQVAQGRARYLLDSVSLVPERSWDSVREELAANFEEASQQDMARLVRADAQ